MVIINSCGVFLGSIQPYDWGKLKKKVSSVGIKKKIELRTPEHKSGVCGLANILRS